MLLDASVRKTLAASAVVTGLAMHEGAAVWVILPEREFRLEKLPADQGTRYGAGRTVLRMGEGEVTLSDGSAASYAGCRIPSAEPAPKPAEPPAAKPAAKP